MPHTALRKPTAADTTPTFMPACPLTPDLPSTKPVPAPRPAWTSLAASTEVQERDLRCGAAASSSRLHQPQEFSHLPTVALPTSLPAIMHPVTRPAGPYRSAPSIPEAKATSRLDRLVLPRRSRPAFRRAFRQVAARTCPLRWLIPARRPGCRVSRASVR